jgi:hypothetical protein
MSKQFAKDVRVSAERVLGERHCFGCHSIRKLVAFDSPKDRKCKDCKRRIERMTSAARSRAASL